MRTVFILAVLFLSGCVDVSAQQEQPAPPGRLLASIKMTTAVSNGSTGSDTVYLFYVETPANVAGPLLTGYEIVDGKNKDVFGGASGSAKVIEAIEAIGLEPFDLQTEISETSVRLSKPGMPFLGPVCVVA